MAKAVKPKVAKEPKAPKEKPELPKVETVETLVGDIEVLSSESPEVKPVIGDEPPSVTLEEVKEVEKVEEKKVEVSEPIKMVEPINTVFDDNLTIEQKIEKFLEGKDSFVRANDFLKSVFGIPKFNEPPKWLNQGSSKLLKKTLDSMVANKTIVVQDNKHRLLGQPYYPNSTTGKQEHRNLNNVEIFMKK